MISKRPYTAREDVLLAEAMLEVRQKYRKGKSDAFCFGFPKVYELFIRKRSKYTHHPGRTMKSVESRIYLLRDAFRAGRLRRVLDCDNLLNSERYCLWSKVLQGERSPRKSQSSRAEEADRPCFQANAHDKGHSRETEHDNELLPSKYKSEYSQASHLHQLQRRRQGAKRLLDAFTKTCNERAEIERRREATFRRQQQFVQDQRKWKKDMLSKLIKKSNSVENEIDSSVFIQSLEDIMGKDAELNRWREKSVEKRMEDDRENWEWITEVFEELLAQYFGSEGGCRPVEK